MTVSPDGKYLYVAGYDDSAIAVFERDTTTGQLSFVEVQKDDTNGVDGLASAASVTVSP
nr:beta-propeller fold lactonase family protein [Nostoc sp. DedQUE02]